MNQKPRPTFAPPFDQAVLKAGLPGDVGMDQQVLDRPQRTIGQTLEALGAYCQDGKLLDGDGREIRFYTDCGYGANPGRERMTKIEAEKRKLLADLQAKYTVIIYKCKHMRE